ncbi:unnamed protein product [Acanthoscelides obtectus]|uniref:Prolyl 4-hydroxylase alpha-subunit N-terminal domain-containing protein n=1 Tax=Acanthoscelides obtectus TaxID=200917 RepID=A0A9P0LG23_ACAOB|nr:unnamed protein product [Acanthoscelides obtectus]CAK1646650.1 Prolyl 4-hydroxylase subunit alpha-2 [Acanthoscelides obtectus]
MLHYHLVIIAFWLFSQVNCEIFTALTDLRELVNTEAVFVQTLENYIRVEELRIGRLKRYIYSHHYEKSAKDVESYVGNPVNAYILIKQLTIDWEEVESIIQSNAGKDYMKNLVAAKMNMKYPTEEDLNGAAVGIFRLQDTYNLDTASLARGELRGVKYSSELTAAECFELGRQGYNNDDFYHTILWMQEASNRLSKEQNKTAKRSDIFDYLAFSIYKEGNISLALELTNKLLEMIPKHERALKNKEYYEKQLQEFKENQGSGIEVQVENELSYMTKRHQSLCRGDLKLLEEVIARLKCRYVTNNNPYLLIGPFKAEELHIDPDLVLFHNVVSDQEIER